MIPPIPPAPDQPAAIRQQDALRDSAVALEAAFLDQMLKSAGVGRTPSAFGGGAGETQFASFLREAQARAMAEAGGIGLAEHIFRSLAERAGER